MSRYIDADALKSKKTYSHERHEYVVPVADIDWMPTVDAVQVVRCKECKKKFARDEDYKGNILKYICLHGAHEPDFFCADGERRDDEQADN